MSRRSWLEVDLSGLEKLLSRRGKEFIVYELIQNAWDEESSLVEISLPRPERGKTRIVVKDDSPLGFHNLNHAFTLFADSHKKKDAGKRGIFNAGEKFVLAFCDEARIISTRGGITFDRKGRRRTCKRTDRGSEFSGVIKLGQEDWASINEAIQLLIPPVETVFNGQLIPSRNPLYVFHTALPTVEADEQGRLRRKTRNTEVRVYEPRTGERAMLYELGIPVVATGDKWHVDIQQKVLLNLERDNVNPSYLQSVRVAVINEMSRFLTENDASSTWIREAAGDTRVDAPAFNKIMDLRFGDNRVTHDPSDPEANLIAVSRGYVVIGSSSLTREEWDNVRRFGSSLPAGRVTPSPKPFSPTGKPLTLLDPAHKTTEHLRFERAAKLLATKLINRRIAVVFADDLNWGFAGCYGNGTLTVNVQTKAPDWFTGEPEVLLERWVPFLVHELAHDRVSGHLTENYHRECCRLAGVLARAIYEQPDLFSLAHL